MGHMVVKQSRIESTVHIMADVWTDIVDETLVLTHEDMLRTLRQAKNTGQDVVVPGSVESLSMGAMLNYFIDRVS